MNTIVAISSLVVDVVVEVDVVNIFEIVVVYSTLIGMPTVLAYAFRVCDVKFLYQFRNY